MYLLFLCNSIKPQKTSESLIDVTMLTPHYFGNMIYHQLCTDNYCLSVGLGQIALSY